MSRRPHVLMLESISDKARRILVQNTSVVETFTPEAAMEACQQQEIHGIVTRGKGQVDQALIKACPHLKVIARCGVGLDNIDVSCASHHKVKVINLPGSNAYTVAEHTLALMLSLQRRQFQSITQVKAGNWDYRNHYQGDEIRGKTVAILGLGNIGKKVAQLIDAFGGNVIYWGRQLQESPYTFCTLEEALMSGDIVSLHLPLVNDTENLLDKKRLALMKSGALLINTSRGAIVHEPSLITALQNGAVGGYATDVLTEEPPAPDHPFLHMDQVLVTPHSASLTATTYRQMCEISVTNLLALLRDEAIDKKYIFNRSLL